MAEFLRVLRLEHVWLPPAGWDALGGALRSNASLQSLKCVGWIGRLIG